MNKEASNRYWEGYLIRYLLGSVVGVICLAQFDSGSSMAAGSKVLGEISVGIRSLFGLGTPGDARMNPYVALILGLAYTYISSAPILVFHSVRLFGKHDSTATIFERRMNVLRTRLLVVFIFGAIGAGVFFALAWLIFDFRARWCDAVLFFLVVIQLAFIVDRLFRSGDVFEKNTLRLARRRDLPGASGFVESYRHLREHGNAFLIALFTIALTVILKCGALPFVWVGVLWISPAASIWVLSISLERYLALNEAPSFVSELRRR